MVKKAAFVLLALAAVGVAAFAVYRQTRTETDPGVVRVSGNVEVTDAEVAFRIPGRVRERRVAEGDWVEAGQVVARLEAEEMEQEVALRATQVEAARAALAELEAGSRPQEIRRARAAERRARARLEELQTGSRPQEVAAAAAAVEAARAEAERLTEDVERQRRLFEREVISAREFQVVEAAHRAARARLREAEERLDLVREGPRTEDIRQAQAALQEAEEHLALVEAGPREEAIDQARARLSQAERALDLARTRLSYAELRSPLSGAVLSDHVEPGEYVSPGTPVVTVGDLEHAWLRAYIPEPDLGRVKLGQEVRVTTDTFPDRSYPGTVTFLSDRAEFTPKNVQTPEERVKLVYRVKIDVPNPERELKPGMPADAEIRSGGR